MLAVFPVCKRDFELAKLNLRWCAELGTYEKHKAVLIPAASLEGYQVKELGSLVLAAKFSEVHAFRQKDRHMDRQKWPVSSNDMFRGACEVVAQKYQCPWIWVEADCNPLRAGWLDELEEEYKHAGKPFMGCLGPEYGNAGRHLTGSAIYPPDVAMYNRFMVNANSGTVIIRPFDTVEAGLTLEHAHITRKIQHCWTWTPPNGPAPSFKDDEDLNRIDPEACCYHRVKDGSLIRLLSASYQPKDDKPNLGDGSIVWRVKEKLGLTLPEPGLMVALPVCNKDAHLLKLNLEWQHELDEHLDYDAVLCFDPTLEDGTRKMLNGLGTALYRKWHEFCYPTPPVLKWPQSCNVAFQNTAKHMKSYGKPWLWLEDDAWPIAPGWLQSLDQAYHQAAKPVFGPVVRGMNHCNGVAIYCHNFCDISPRAMSATTAAWDAACRPDLDGKIHDASDLFAHIWAQLPHRFTANGGSSLPVFDHPRKLKWIPETSLIVHRVKNGSLVNLLRSQRLSTQPQ